MIRGAGCANRACPDLWGALGELITQVYPTIELDWERIRFEADYERTCRPPAWQRYPLWAKPVGFVVTSLQAALTPWVLAMQLSGRTGVRWAAGYVAICLCIALVVCLVLGNEPGLWMVGVLTCLLLQTFVLGFLLPPWHCVKPYSFWFKVTCYTSYPLLLECWFEPPYILWGTSNIWPFAYWDSLKELACVTSVLFYLWWLGLKIIAWLRIKRSKRRRVWLLILAVPALTFASSYSGCYFGDMIFGSF